MDNQKTLLIAIFVAVLAILGFVVYENQQDTPAENVAESINEASEEIGDEIDDSTTN